MVNYSITEKPQALGGARWWCVRSSQTRRQAGESTSIHPSIHPPTYSSSSLIPLPPLSPFSPSRSTARRGGEKEKGAIFIPKAPDSFRWDFRLIPRNMCPLRVILIFLSATIAGFFLLRGIKADPYLFQDDDAAGDDDNGSESPRAPAPLHSKVGSAVKTGFWTMVDMASGRYLWRTLVVPPAKSGSEKAR